MSDAKKQTCLDPVKCGEWWACAVCDPLRDGANPVCQSCNGDGSDCEGSRPSCPKCWTRTAEASPGGIPIAKRIRAALPDCESCGHSWESHLDILPGTTGPTDCGDCMCMQYVWPEKRPASATPVATMTILSMVERGFGSGYAFNSEEVAHVIGLLPLAYEEQRSASATPWEDNDEAWLRVKVVDVHPDGDVRVAFQPTTASAQWATEEWVAAGNLRRAVLDEQGTHIGGVINFRRVLPDGSAQHVREHPLQQRSTVERTERAKGQPMTDSTEAIRLLMALGEARFRFSLKIDNQKHAEAAEELAKATTAVEEAADDLWLDWLSDQSR